MATQVTQARFAKWPDQATTENRLSKGEDIIEQEPRQRPFIPSTRPEWMYDTALLPRRPPGAKT